jgi:hypothetical protein
MSSKLLFDSGLDLDDDDDDAIAVPLAKRIVKRDRTSPARAGALMGAIGALGMVAATDAVMGLHSADTHPFVALLGSPFEAYLHAPAPWHIVAAAAFAAALGAVVGAFFARLTKRLVKLVPLLLWTTLFFGALWIVFDAFLLARFPGASARVPFLPVLAGIEAFALILCLQLPVRLRRAIEVDEA